MTLTVGERVDGLASGEHRRFAASSWKDNLGEPCMATEPAGAWLDASISLESAAADNLTEALDETAPMSRVARAQGE